MSDQIPKPRFTGIFIPVEILECEDLTPTETMLLSWIDALYCEEHGGCYASNDYLANRLRVKENTIAKSLTKFRKLGLIEDVSFNGRNRVIRSTIGKFVDQRQSKAALDLNPKQGWTKIQGSVGQKSKAPIKDIPYIDTKEDIKINRSIDPLKVEIIEELDALDLSNADKLSIASECKDKDGLINAIEYAKGVEQPDNMAALIKNNYRNGFKPSRAKKKAQAEQSRAEEAKCRQEANKAYCERILKDYTFPSIVGGVIVQPYGILADIGPSMVMEYFSDADFRENLNYFVAVYGKPIALKDEDR